MKARIFRLAALAVCLVVASILTLAIGKPAHAVTFDWVMVGIQEIQPTPG